ncbi:dimethyladenosine transferase 1, mitochondrial [Metopolophium dirhodum]|uniref:dimethyladenosine transferase 1, mitochondrial n=1 Tax=Metopolophium dirhodum TaxID=44670 RepID=UPI00298F9D47|nr:dimethyladenosine transferase 1, mitochondrial [Metopolophium dirhodum]
MSVSRIIRLPPLPSIRDLIKLYKLRAMKELSQNFLMEPRLISRIVRSAGSVKDCEVCEVGPGPGNITRSIIQNMPSRVLIIEKDKRFTPSLELLAESSPVPLELIFGDVMNFNLEQMFNEDNKMEWEDKCPQIHLIGNLPFNVSTPLIIRWLKAISERKSAWRYGRVRMTLTFQKEVAERMAAPIMTRERSRLSVMCQNWCRVEHKFNIPGRAFIPKPNVDVGVVRLTPLKKPIIDLPFDIIEKVVRSVFSFRQKHCTRGVETLFPKPVREQLASELLTAAAIEPSTRPFQLTVSEFGRISEAYMNICKEKPDYMKYNYRGQKSDDNWPFVEINNSDSSENIISINEY